jgi:hypothetical protein
LLTGLTNKLNCNNLSVINTSINEVGVNYLKNFKSIKDEDLSASSGLYFLNTQPNSNNLSKLIKLKLLNYLPKNNNWPNYCLDQNFGLKSTSTKLLQENNNVYNYINLPNNSFFESTGTFINTEGILKNNIKFISTSNQTKEDWQIIRKIFSSFENVKFLNLDNKNYLTINQTNFNLIKYFFSFLYYPLKNIDTKNHYSYGKKTGQKYYFDKTNKQLKY